MEVVDWWIGVLVEWNLHLGVRSLGSSSWIGGLMGWRVGGFLGWIGGGVGLVGWVHFVRGR